MKDITKVEYDGPFTINSTQTVCGSKSQIVSHSILIEDIDMIEEAEKIVIDGETIEEVDNRMF